MAARSRISSLPRPGHGQRGHFRLITEARDRQSEIAYKKKHDEYVNPRLSRIRFGELARQRLDASIDLRDSTEATNDSYMRSHILPRFEDRPIGSLRPAEIQAWIAELVAKGLSPKTVRECYGLLASILKLAVDSAFLVQSPCGHAVVKLPRIPRQEQRFL